MGTPHLIVVTDREGVVKVRQYAKWDGYFSGKGQEMLELISSPGFLAQLEAKLPIVKLFHEGDPNLPYTIWGDGEWFARWGDFSLSWKVLRNIAEANEVKIRLRAEPLHPIAAHFSYHIDYHDRTWTATKHQHPDRGQLVYSLDQLPTIKEFLEATAQWRTEDE